MTKKSNRGKRKKWYARRGGRKQLILPPPSTHPQQEEQRRSLQEEGTEVSLACTIPLSTIGDGVEKLDCDQVARHDGDVTDDLVRSSDTKENNQTDANSLTNSPVSTTSSSGHHTKLMNMSPIATIPHVLAIPATAARGLFPASIGVDLTDNLAQSHDSITVISVLPSSSSGVSSSCDISPRSGSVVPAMSPFDDDDDGDGVSSTTPNLEPPLPCSNKKKRQKRKRKRQQQQRVMVVNPPPPLLPNSTAHPSATKQDRTRDDTNDITYKNGYQVPRLGGHDKEAQDSSNQSQRKATSSLLLSNSTTTTTVGHVDKINGNGAVVYTAESTMDVEENATEEGREANRKSEPKPLDFREENGQWQLMAEFDETEEESKGVVKMENTRFSSTFEDETEGSREEAVVEEVKMEAKTPFPSTFEELILMHFHHELNVAELVESMNCLEQDNKANEEQLAVLMKQVSLLTSEKNELEKAFSD